MVDCCWFSLAARVSAAAAVAAQAKACISEFCSGIKEALDINSSYLNRTHPNQVRQLLLFQSIASNNTFSLATSHIWMWGSGPIQLQCQVVGKHVGH